MPFFYDLILVLAAPWRMGKSLSLAGGGCASQGRVDTAARYEPIAVPVTFPQNEDHVATDNCYTQM